MPLVFFVFTCRRHKYKQHIVRGSSFSALFLSAIVIVTPSFMSLHCIASSVEHFKMSCGAAARLYVRKKGSLFLSICRLNFSFFPSIFTVMHLGAVAAMLFRYHNNKTLSDLLRRLDKDMLIGTLVFSDPATGIQAQMWVVIHVGLRQSGNPEVVFWTRDINGPIKSERVTIYYFLLLNRWAQLVSFLHQGQAARWWYHSGFTVRGLGNQCGFCGFLRCWMHKSIICRRLHESQHVSYV